MNKLKPVPVPITTNEWAAFCKNYAAVAVCTILIYDYLTTLDEEISYIWTSSPLISLSTIVFFLNRYLVFVAVSAFVADIAFVHTFEDCKTIMTIVTSSAAAGIIVSETILSLRTIALWKGSKRITIFLGALALATMIPALMIAFTVTTSIKFREPLCPYERLGCSVAWGDRALFISFLLLALFEFVTVILTTIKAFQYSRASITSGTWLANIYRQGLAFYIFTLFFTLLNMVLPLLVPLSYSGLLTVLLHLIHSFCSTRIIFLLHKYKQNSAEDSKEERTGVTDIHSNVGVMSTRMTMDLNNETS